jgi:hypothetical protein
VLARLCAGAAHLLQSWAPMFARRGRIAARARVGPTMAMADGDAVRSPEILSPFPQVGFDLDSLLGHSRVQSRVPFHLLLIEWVNPSVGGGARLPEILDSLLRRWWRQPRSSTPATASRPPLVMGDQGGGHFHLGPGALGVVSWTFRRRPRQQASQ